MPLRALLVVVLFLICASLTSADAVEKPPAPSNPPAVVPVPSPVEPEDSLKYLEIDPGLAVELVAAEPDVIDPVAAAFDEHGQLWVVEMTDYPNGPKANEPPLSRIRVLSPLENQPGRFGNAVTFAEKLLFANGLMLWKGGVIVTADASVLYLKDTDGDGKADKNEIWFSGFVKGNPQLRCNHPTLGLDGRIYVANGLRGGAIVANKEVWGKELPPVNLSGMDFCFDPTTGECEAISGLGQFGLCFDDYGNRFVCSNRNPCQHVVLEDRDIKRNPNLVVTSVMEQVSPPAEKSHIYAISRPWTTSTQHAGQFTAACGLSIFRGDGLPAAYYGNSFTCEPTANVVHRDVLRPNGASFTAVPSAEQREFLASRDEWFRPVYTFSGPDGALYVCDMYRAVIEHPEYMPEELKTRPDLTLGNDRGRIYRIKTAGATAPVRTVKGAKAEDDPRNVLALWNPNAWQRETAARLILQDREKGVSKEPVQFFMEGAEREAPATAVQLLALRGILRAEGPEFYLGLLTDSVSTPVREFAVRLVAGRFAGNERVRKALLQIASDQPNGALRFRVALALGAFRVEDDSLDWLAEALTAAPEDSWLSMAVATSVPKDGARLASRYWEKLASRPLAAEGRVAAAELERIRGLYQSAAAQSDKAAAVELVAGLFTQSKQQGSAPRLRAAIQGIGRGLKNRGERVSHLLGELPAAPRARIAELFTEAAAIVQDESSPLEGRLDAVRILALAPTDILKPAAIPLLTSSIHELTAAAIEALGGSDDPQVAALLVEGYRRRTPALRSVILGQLLTSEPRITALVTAIEEGEISLRELDSGRLTVLQRQKTPELKERIDKLVKAAAPADRSTVLAEYQPVLQRKGDPLKGREIFAKNCVTCHKIGDLGVNVAPDIADSRVKTPVQLLTDILDPNKAIDNNYFSYTVVDQQGQIYTGIMSAETASSVTLKQPENKTVSILRSEIDEIRSNGVSLMPVGLEKSIPPEQMADLISFIKNWRYLDGQVPKDVIR